jgi:SAM-dependent methyltransferase
MVERKKLNIGCGMKKLPGWINVDFNERFHPDLVWDITKRSVFEPDTVDEIYCDNVMEHIPDFISPMREFHRILKPGGRIRIIVPHFTSVFWDIPSHRRPFGYYTFHHFSKAYKPNRETEDIGAYFSRVRTRFVFTKKFQVWNHIIEPLANMMPVIYEQTFLRSLFPCWLLDITLIK